MSSRLDTGDEFGEYRIVRMLGRGGMGIVFLAEDTRLGRQVALKLLVKQSTSDPGRVQRFMQEARAASALNHPGIITVYEIGEVDGARFMATEFVDGVTLRQQISGNGLELGEIVEIATDVASALSAAHEARIVHRDIKPENIMIRTDGYVKVLDFGLAKLNQAEADPDEVDTVVPGLAQTTPGLIMGTAQYMSPEQARGVSVDARSDIFSLGIVLYEMLAKRPPFSGDTPSHQLVAILEKEPVPIRQLVPAIPAELDRILAKMLAKDRNYRYQSTKDLAIDLKQLKKHLDVDAELRRWSPSGGYGPPTAQGAPGDPGSAPPPFSTGGAPVYTPSQYPPSGQYAQYSPGAPLQTSGAYGQPPQAGQPPYQPSAPYPPPPAFAPSGQHPAPPYNPSGAYPAPASFPPAAERGAWAGLAGRKLAAIAAALALLAAAGWTTARFWPRRSAPFQSVSLNQLTNTGNVDDAVISPDGRYVVYSVTAGSEESLNLRQVGTGSTVQIQQPFSGSYLGLTFSADGEFVYFVKQENGSIERELYKVPSLGGTATKVLTDIDSAVTLSPDNKHFVFTRWATQTSQGQVVMRNLDGSGERALFSTKIPMYPASFPVWSPDGKWIALAVHDVDASGSYTKLLCIPADGGEPKMVGGRWGQFARVAWLPDSRGLLAAASKGDVASSKQIWILPFPSGPERKLTNDLNSYSTVSLTSDGKSLLTLKDELVSSLWLQSADNPAGAREITSPGTRYEGYKGLSWTSDGKLIYTARGASSVELWLREPGSGESRQLTADNAGILQPRVSADGQYVVFGSDRQSRIWHIWRYGINDGGYKQLTFGGGESYGTLSPDGADVVYVSMEKDGLWKQPVAGGAPRQITTEADYYPAYSPDGKAIAYTFTDETEGKRTRIGVRPAAGGPPVKIFDLETQDAEELEWLPDGGGLSYISNENGISQIWVQALAGGAPRQITKFQNYTIFSHGWSARAKEIAVARGNWNSDAVLIKQQ